MLVSSQCLLTGQLAPSDLVNHSQFKSQQAITLRTLDTLSNQNHFQALGVNLIQEMQRKKSRRKIQAAFFLIATTYLL
ncbi:hypothetical protein LQF05_16885 [Stutzerimonas stutzeri]|uniref:hypothetical protein n=1 Tax=Stutzerimonas stutzeri TaxID=316 RepID=UPI0022DE0A08|nr:hypothetical protein [Stutzerimonas stutzeri]WBL62411.1 hypothetical protein LQF05_16885 [Stutzerimonas stutzeri]